MQWRTKFFPMVLALLVALPGPVRAAPLACRTDYEAIINLHPPRLGTPSAWDAMYSQQGKAMQLVSGVATANGTVMVLGRTLSLIGAVPQSIVMAEINQRSRVTSEKSWPAKPGEWPVKIIATPDGYAVLTNRQTVDKTPHLRARLAWYGRAGKLLHETVLSSDVSDYQATAMTAMPGGGLLVALRAINHKQSDDRQGMLARFGAGGGEIWRRTYSSGAPGEIDGVAAAGGKNYLATGWVRLDNGRHAGWAMDITADGAIVWQKNFPRGANAELKRSAHAAGDTPAGQAFLLAGDIAPSDGGPRALWLLALDAEGTPLWQRYARAKDFALAVADIMMTDDGRALVAVNAKATGADPTGRDHVRLLTISPHGGLLGDEAYIEGVGAQAGDMVRGWNDERIVTTTILSDEKPLDLEMTGSGFKAAGAMAAKDGTGKETKPVDRGWVFVASAPDAYKDTVTSHE